MFSRAIKRSVVAATAAVVALGLGAVEANAAPWTFTPQNPDYRADVSGGHFTSQIRYSTGAWQASFKLDAATSAPATGTMSEKVDLYCNGRSFMHDSHPAVNPRVYVIHMSKMLGDRMTRCNWDLKIHETFPIGGRGTRTVDVDFPFIVTLV